jgi:hypothetical protein
MHRGVKRVFLASSSSRSSFSHTQESMSQDLAWPSSFIPPQHKVTQSSYSPTQVEVPTKDDDNIATWNTEEW